MRWQIFILAVLVSALPSVADVKSSAPLTSVGSSVQETSLGDLVADAVCESAGAPIAFVPASSFKEITIPAGTVSVEAVQKCLQYPNDRMVVINLTGEHILKALERSVSIFPQKNGAFLQVSGLTFSFNPDQPKGSRVAGVTIGKEKLDTSREYQVAVPESLADGGGGYFTVWGKDRRKHQTDGNMADAVENFLSARNSVDYRKLNRITRAE